MKIRSDQAVSLFFPSTSMKFVYYEAIANSIDAGADHININISLSSFAEPETLEIDIIDNGGGFTDERFERFNHALDKSDEQHKGIGRFVFLKYFDKIEIESCYGEAKRVFTFSSSYDGENILTVNDDSSRETALKFRSFSNVKIKEYAYVTPSDLKTDILEHFLPRFYQMKLDGDKMVVDLNLDVKKGNIDVGFVSSTERLDIAQLPELKERQIDDDARLFGYFKLLYSIDKTFEDSSVISAICADGRTIPMEIISNKSFPAGYKMVFILYSDQFDGKTNPTRESLFLEESQLRHVKKIFTSLISEVVKEQIPEVEKHNKKVNSDLETHYPHLQGYFDSKTVGLVDETATIQNAQNKFFKDQKEILEAESLDNAQYEKSLEHSSRILTEYILYRTKIIQKLKSIDKDSSEADIHNLLVPQRKVYKNKSIDDIFSNNAWVVDDKYMTYSKVLSDIEIEKIYTEIEVEGSHLYSENENGRPDITIILSDDPEQTERVDVIIVELKKLDLKLADKETIISQLKQRARRLFEYYPDKIQRLWFYSIIDFDKEFEASIREDGFKPLYSKGELFCKPQDIVLRPATMETVTVDLFLLSYDAMLSDAEARNYTFLNILKEGFKQPTDSE
jgi:hypothetical protein